MKGRPALAGCSPSVLEPLHSARPADKQGEETTRQIPSTVRQSERHGPVSYRPVQPTQLYGLGTWPA